MYLHLQGSILGTPILTPSVHGEYGVHGTWHTRQKPSVPRCGLSFSSLRKASCTFRQSRLQALGPCASSLVYTTNPASLVQRHPIQNQKKPYLQK
jgi:hypothetical protein